MEQALTFDFNALYGQMFTQLFTEIADNCISMLSTISPIAIAIVGIVWVVQFGISYFLELSSDEGWRDVGGMNLKDAW